MKLLLDSGNSRIKWAVLDKGELVQTGDVGRTGDHMQDTLMQSWSGLPAPRAILLANVAGSETGAELRELVQAKWSLPIRVLSACREQAGVRNAYAVPGQMGVDRWLALVGAWHRFHAATCVVDAGTAVTVDFIDDSGRHLGGYIAPGFGLMLDALRSGTSVDPDLVGGADPAPRPGRSTRECVSNGALLAVSGLVRHAIELLPLPVGGSMNRIVTGGAADMLLTVLGPGFVQDPMLVFRGMSRVSEED